MRQEANANRGWGTLGALIEDSCLRRPGKVKSNLEACILGSFSFCVRVDVWVQLPTNTSHTETAI